MKYYGTTAFVLMVTTYVNYVLGCPICDPAPDVRQACYPLKQLQQCSSTGPTSPDCACHWKIFIDSIPLENLNKVPSGHRCYIWARDRCTEEVVHRKGKQRPRSVPSIPSDGFEVTKEQQTLDEAIFTAQKLRAQVDHVKDPIEKQEISEKLVQLLKKISTLQGNIRKKPGASQPGIVVERQKDAFIGHVPFAQDRFPFAKILVDSDNTDEDNEATEKRESIQDVKFKLTIFVAILLFNIIIFIVAIVMRCERKPKGVGSRTVGDLDPKTNIKLPFEDNLHRSSLDNFLDKLRGHMRQKALENAHNGSTSSTKAKYRSLDPPIIAHRHVSSEFSDHDGTEEESSDDVFREGAAPSFRKTDDSFEVAEIDIPNKTHQKARSVTWHDHLDTPRAPSVSSLPARGRHDRPTQTNQESSQVDFGLFTMLNH